MGGAMTTGSDVIQRWPIDSLRPHPENASIFGAPEAESDRYEEILKSIKQHGMWDPIYVREDGVVLSGHLRLACAHDLGMSMVPVRVFSAFPSYWDELSFLIRSNTDRRQLTPVQIARAFKKLKETPRAQGGAKARRGRPEDSVGGKKKVATSRQITRDSAADHLGVSRDVAEACEAVFDTPGVPEALKAAVNDGRVAPTTAAKAVRAEKKRQGGEIKSPTSLAALADKPVQKPTGTEHEQRVAEASARYGADFRALTEAYRTIDSVLHRRPLTSVLGPSEHQEYAALIKDIAIRAWREIEGVEGKTTLGRQMSLTVVRGGKS